MGLRAEVASLDEENSKLRVLLSMREHPSEDVLGRVLGLKKKAFFRQD